MRNGDDYLLAEALAEAEKSAMKHRMGAVLAHKKRVLAKGHNRWHGQFDHKHRGSIHAEVAALKRLRGLDRGSLTLYVARERAKNARPCSICMKAISRSPVKRVVYTYYGEIQEILL